MSLKDKFMNLISPVEGQEEDEQYIEFDESEVQQLSDYEKGAKEMIKVDAKMVLFEPRTYEESQEIGRHLKERHAAVVNLQRLPANFSQRTVDFLQGVTFALEGQMQKISHNVVLCTPKSIGVSGTIDLESKREQ